MSMNGTNEMNDMNKKGYQTNKVNMTGMNMGIDNDLDIENFAELATLANPTVAFDFLITLKSGIRNISFAISETATPDVKTILHNQLNESLALHERLTDLMINKGWLHPNDLSAQFKLDLVSANAVLKVCSLDLFPHQPPVGAPGNTMSKEGNELGN